MGFRPRGAQTMNPGLAGRAALITSFTRGSGCATPCGLADLGAGLVRHGRTWVETQSERPRQLARSEGRSVDELERETCTVRRTSSPLGRCTAPEEVAHLFCHVCSRAAVAANGASLSAGGGIVRNYS